MFKGLIGALRIDLGMNSAEFHKGRKDATAGLYAMRKEFANVARDLRMAGAGMSIALTAPLVAIGKQAVELQKVQARAVAQVDAALASMGEAAGFTSAELQAIAGQLQGGSLFGDEEILGKVTSNLLTFGNVTGEVFTRAQQMALDMSAALGQDLQGATIMLGKALNDPAAGLTALTRVGVSFTEEQKKTIQAMVELGDAAGAQKLMLSELERQYGGQAQALRDLPSGQIEAAMMDIGDAMEQVGAIILPVLADIAGHVSDAARAFQSLSPEVKRLVVVLGSTAAALGPATLALGSLAAAASVLVPALAAAVIPVGAIALAVGALVGAVAVFGRNADGATSATDELTGAIGDEITQSHLLTEALGTNGTMSVEMAREKLQEAQARHENVAAIIAEQKAMALQSDDYSRLTREIEDAQSSLNSLGFPATDDAVPRRADAFEAAQQRLVDLLKERADLLKADKAQTEQLARTEANIASLEQKLAEASDGAIRLGDNLVDPIEPTDRLTHSFDELGRQGSGTLEELRDELAKVTEEAHGLKGALQSALSSLASGDVAGAFGNLKSGIASAATSSFGNLISASFASGGAGFSGIVSGLSQSIGGISTALSGLGGGLVSSLGAIGTAVSAALPVIGAVTAAVGIIKGFSSKKLIGAGLQLGVADGALLAGSYETYKKKSWWGLKSSRSTRVRALDEDMQAALADELANVQDAVRQAFHLAGKDISDAMIDGVGFAMRKIDTRDMSEAQVQEAVAEWFSGYADAMADGIASVSFEQVQALGALKAMLEPLGQGFRGAFDEMALAAEGLATMAGGIDTLGGQLQSFAATFYSDAERLKMAGDALNAQFEDLGLAVPATAREFRELVMSQDLMTESGKETYLALLGLSDLFAEVEGGISDLTGAFELGGYYASEFDARLAAIAEARGYSAQVLASGDAGVTLAGAVQSLASGDVAQTSALRRLVTLLEGWDAYGTPDTREF